MKTAPSQPGINIEGEVGEKNKPGRKWTARLDNVRQWKVGSLRIAWETSGTRDDWRMSTAVMMVMTKNAMQETEISVLSNQRFNISELMLKLLF